MGKTIKHNVNEFLEKELSGKGAILWALADYNTTKTGNISGGLGLKLILDFLKLNEGKMQIISADGYWSSENNKTYSISYFPGTAISIEFNLNDSNSYKLSSEISLNNIF